MRNKYIIAGLAAFLVFALGFAIKWMVEKAHSDRLQFDFASKLAELGVTEGPVEYAHLVPFDWDELMYLGPYSNAKEDAIIAGVIFPQGVRNSGMESRDDRGILIFAKKKKCVGWSIVPNSQLIIRFAGSPLPQSRAESRVAIAPESGWNSPVARFAPESIQAAQRRRN